jgi:hypothetical protein
MVGLMAAIVAFLPVLLFIGEQLRLKRTAGSSS